MMLIKNNELYNSYRNLCIVMIWCTVLYSSIIQNKFLRIPNGMLMLGAAILISYTLANNGKPFDFYEVLTDENQCMLYYLVYMFVVGLLFSPYSNIHVSQCITCVEYLFLQIVIASIIKRSGTDIFHTMLLVIATMLVVIFLREPVETVEKGRYTISAEVNPNGLGMEFAAGIWAALYRKNQKSKQPLVLTFILIAVFAYCILLTGSRKSLIGASLAIILWLFLCFLPSLKEKDYFLAIVTVFIMIILVIVTGWKLLSVYSDSKIASRMGNLLIEASEGNRSNMYREGYELFKSNPLFGSGFQSFAYYYGTYSHATLVEIPVSGGIIGSLLYFSAYFVSLRKIVRIYKKTKGIQEYSPEHKKIKMVFILFTVMVFYMVCIIHPYQFASAINFGIIFGETAYIESKLNKKQETSKIGSKYIRYE